MSSSLPPKTVVHLAAGAAAAAATAATSSVGVNEVEVKVEAAEAGDVLSSSEVCLCRASILSTAKEGRK